MKLKIFNKALFTLISVMAIAGAFAQKRTDSVTQNILAAPIIPIEPLPAFSEFSQPMAMDIFGQQDTTYRKEYRKLETQMSELRKKMSKLRTDAYKKTMRDTNNKSYHYHYHYDSDYDSKSPAIKAEVQKNIDKGFEGLQKLSYTYSDNVSGASKGLGVASSSRSYYNGNKGDDYIRKKIASGEAKEKTKSYTKSYAIDRDDNISIDNSFGKVTVNTWAKNEVKVDVQIKAVADDDAKAQKLLDGVSIADNKTASTVTFKTNFDDDDDNRWSSNNHIRKTEVNYTVYMPAKSAIVIKNRYGSIKTPDLSGKVMVNLTYGNLNAERLSNPQNEVVVKYGDANIENLNSKALNLSFGNMNIGTADNLNAKLSNAGGNIDKLKSAGDISIRYGDGVKVGQLVNVKNLNVDASYTKVLVNVKDDYNFDVNTRMGSFNYDGNNAVKVIEITPSNNRGVNYTKTYKGTVGKGNPAKTITITSKLSNVKFDDANN